MTERTAPTHNYEGKPVHQAKFVSGGHGGEDGWIVLCFLPENELHPYVTWWLRDRDLLTVQGHYFETLEDAKADFEKRH